MPKKHAHILLDTWRPIEIERCNDESDNDQNNFKVYCFETLSFWPPHEPNCMFQTPNFGISSKTWNSLFNVCSRYSSLDEDIQNSILEPVK